MKSLGVNLRKCVYDSNVKITSLIIEIKDLNKWR